MSLKGLNLFHIFIINLMSASPVTNGSASAGGKDLSNDAQIRAISPMEPEICTKMLKKLSEKLRAKFPASTHGHSMAKIACLDDAFSECFKLEASPVEGRSLQQKEKKRTERKGEKK